MGKRQDAMKRLMLAAGANIARGSERCRLIDDFEPQDVRAEVSRIYHLLGGRQTEPRTTPGSWDLELDEFSVELDEERHFNRYRELTLGSPLYLRPTGFDPARYRQLSRENEPRCLKAAKHGGNWTSVSTEKAFGPSAPEGVLDAVGPARWKQRAFYDFLKDVYSLAKGQQMRRVSIYDRFEDAGMAVSVDDALQGRLKRTSDVALGMSLLTALRTSAFT